MNPRNRAPIRHAIWVLVLPLAVVIGASAAQEARTGTNGAARAQRPAIAAAFDRFAPAVRTRFDAEHLFVESDGMPDHELMVGIVAWQQQVPLPQPYTGDNAWPIPLAPVPASNPMSAKTDFFRGAIAIAVNGVPIFNPIKNDGKTDTFLAGELDAFGGHSGRADDYHYHVAPVFLNGGDAKRPVAFALDGYPIYGFTEPDGTPARKLDAFNGHDDDRIGYHYHATKTYPYLNGGFHGRVVEKDGQVDPQPHAHPVREATSPLPGARITAFRAEPDHKTYTVTYDLRGKTGSVRYTIQDDGSYRFVFREPDGSQREEVYRPGPARDAKSPPESPRGEERPRNPRRGPDPNDPARRPWLVEHLGEIDTNHDGALSLEEMVAESDKAFRAYDRDGDGRIGDAERRAGSVKSAMGGFVQEHWNEIDADADDVVTASELGGLARSMFGKSDRDGDSRITAAELDGAGQEPRGEGRRRGDGAGRRSGEPGAGGNAGGNTRGSSGRAQRAGGGPEGTFHAEVPAHDFDVILGRPTRDSVTVSVLPASVGEACLEYGPEASAARTRTDVRALVAGEPCEFKISGLAADTRYVYHLMHRVKGSASFASEPACSFRTARAPKSEFTFTIQADSHLDEGTETAVYRRSLEAQAADAPDFVIDLGDTFMTDKFRGDFREAASQYVAQRYWLGLVAKSSPLFLVLGNHDGESRWRDPGDADDMPHWSNAMRARYFPNPEPNDFYSGNAREDRWNGMLGDYYAWEWGDALFVVLDPYLSSTVRGGGGGDDPWRWTLGAEQYAWLARTLAGSRAPFKFVFTHHLLGGNDRNARGGSEAARLYEWGGREADGTSAFAVRRPGFEAPIHDLLSRAGVQAVFHGHDHFYARQELDGIVYQLVPQPSHPDGEVGKTASEGGYVSGKFLASPGYVRVRVTPERARVDYVQSLDDDPSRRKVAESYTLEPRTANPSTRGASAPRETPGGASPTPPQEPNAPRKRRAADDDTRGGRRDRAREGVEGPLADRSVILGRPTADSVAVSVRSSTAVDAFVEYAVQADTKSDVRGSKSATVACPAGTPTVIELTGLRSDTRYSYRLHVRSPGATAFVADEPASFVTARAAGRTFTFGVQGDSHPERSGKMYAPELYERTLKQAASDALDFYVTLGDDFSIERLIERDTLSQESVDRVYAHQRGFLGIVGRSSPLFLVNGNHEEAAGYLLDGTPDNAAVYAGRARTRHFPLPTPSPFYSGDSEEIEHVGLLSDYYAWTWGDALFVVIDPYWHSRVQVDADAGGGGKGEARGGKAGGRRDMWGITLGEAQYRWFAKTLSESRARHKFVFAHHVLGTGRGGVEVADLYEWGGRDPRGVDAFASKRPGWELPIHALMAKHGVTVFFQGHDHLFARQEKDGVVYQETPNPADSTYQAFNREAYRSGDVLPNAGYLRVTVAPETVRVDYVRCYLPGDEPEGVTSGDVAFSYTIPAAK